MRGERSLPSNLVNNNIVFPFQLNPLSNPLHPMPKERSPRLIYGETKILPVKVSCEFTLDPIINLTDSCYVPGRIFKDWSRDLGRQYLCFSSESQSLFVFQVFGRFMIEGSTSCPIRYTNRFGNKITYQRNHLFRF